MFKVYGIHIRVLPILISLVIGTQVFGQSVERKFPAIEDAKAPTILTDKRNYQTGETLDIAGVNFRSFERVRLSVKVFENNLNQEILLQRWDTYADGKGRIFGSWDIPEVNEGGNRFILEATGRTSGKISKTEVSTFAPAAISVKMEQCANSNAAPQDMDCDATGPAGWVTGLVGGSKASYFEGDSIAYRNIMEDLVIGHEYKWTVEYDTSKGGDNALDYLTTYNRSITGADPCDNQGGGADYCVLAAPTSTIGIPIDPFVTDGRDGLNGTTDDITQIPGVVTAWGANITAITSPSYTGTFPGGDSTASVDITFTATATTAVIAWGGHTSTRTDWGQPNGSVNITGAPYHTNNAGLMLLTAGGVCCGGSQDLQLQESALAATSKITIVKHATPPSVFNFGFTTTNLSPGSFSLTDNDVATDPSIVFDGISTFDIKTIEETVFGPYDLQSIVCTVDVGTGGTPAPNRVGNAINIDIKSGDEVTCTFNNDFVTAATVSVSGRVFDSGGNGLSRAYVTSTNQNGIVKTVMTNSFGYYRIDEIEAGDALVLQVQSKGHVFATRFVDVGEELTSLDFTATASYR